MVYSQVHSAIFQSGGNTHPSYRMNVNQPHVDLRINLFGPWTCKRWLSQVNTKHNSCSKGNRRIYSEPNMGGRGPETQTRVTLYGNLSGKHPLLPQTFEYLILSW